MSILLAGTRDVKSLIFLITYITITSEYEYAAASRQAVLQPTAGYGNKHLTSATRHLLQNADAPALNDDGGVTMESKLVTRLSLLTAPANS
jgi:hypothetical protein